MRKKFLIIIFVAAACPSLFAVGDIPFFKSLFMGDEEYVKQEILKCKDVESVEIVLSHYDSYDDDKTYSIYVHLTENRYITFSDVTLWAYLRGSEKANNFTSIHISQINDIVPVERVLIPARINFIHKTVQYDYNLQSFFVRHILKSLPELKMNNILDVINNFDAVYKFIASLPESPYKYPWYIHFKESIPFSENFIFPNEFIDDVPFSITEYEKFHDYLELESEIIMEYRYKFYKMSVEDAQRKYPYTNFKTDF